MKKSKPRYLIIKLLKTIDQEKILKAARKKRRGSMRIVPFSGQQLTQPTCSRTAVIQINAYMSKPLGLPSNLLDLGGQWNWWWWWGQSYLTILCIWITGSLGLHHIIHTNFLYLLLLMFSKKHLNFRARHTVFSFETT